MCKSSRAAVTFPPSRTQKQIDEDPPVLRAGVGGLGPAAPTAEARQCSFTVTPTTFAVGSSRASRTLSIITGTRCSWTGGERRRLDHSHARRNGTGIGAVTFTVPAESHERASERAR